MTHITGGKDLLTFHLIYFQFASQSFLQGPLFYHLIKWNIIAMV